MKMVKCECGQEYGLWDKWECPACHRPNLKMEKLKKTRKVAVIVGLVIMAAVAVYLFILFRNLNLGLF